MLEKLLKRPVAVTMLLLSICVLGVVSALQLPISLIPDVNIPYITVQVDAPQMSARELDESVVRPLRSQMVQIDGLKDINCTSRDGSANIKLSFSHSDKIDYRFIEVNEKIDRAMGSLPNIGRPKVLKASATDIPAFYINVTSRDNKSDFLALSRFVQDVIVKRIEQLDEVAMADVSGTEEPEILIVPDESRLRQAGIRSSDLERLVASADIRLGGLTIADGQYRYGVRFQSNVGGAEDIAELWLNHDGHLLQLKDVAEVVEQPAPRAGMLTSDGKQAVSLAIVSRSDSKLKDLRKGVSSLLESFQQDYPQLEFTVTRDQTRLLDYSIRNLILNIIVGILLACIVIFLFMQDGRSSALIAITIPVALILSMLVFRLAGMSLNIVSLSGLLLGVGMMTDNSLVLVDNITGRWKRGESLWQAVGNGTREVTAPMLSSILTTCAVFVPLVSVSGIAGALFRDQALAVSIVLFSSYLVTILVIPVYYWSWYKGKDSPESLRRKTWTERLERWEHNWTTWILKHLPLSWIIVGVSVVGCIICLEYMPRQMLPDITRDEVQMRVDWGGSISPDENVRRCSALEQTVSAQQSTVMAGVQQFLLDHDAALGSSQAQLYFKFPDERSLADAQKVLSKTVGEFWPAAQYSFEEAGNIFDLVFGSKEDLLVARLRPVTSPTITVPQLQECIAGIKRAVPGVKVGTVPVQEQIMFVADPQQMALYGVSYDQIMSALRSALNGNNLMKIVQGDKSVPVVLGSDNESLAGLLQNTEITVKDASIPLSALMVQAPYEDLKTIVSGQEGEYYPLPIDVPAKSIGQTMAQVRRAVVSDGNFETGFSGSWFTTRKMVNDLVWTLLIAVLLLYLILAAQFESLVQPLLILLEIVIDIFFALAVIWILGESINLMSLIGLVVITGIVINDSILKVDTINRLRKEGMRIDEAILTAGSRRVKAILMTSLTTILAVAPFLAKGNMGADLQYPMTLVIIVGMTVGTLVSLFIVPALYRSVYRENE